MLPLLIQPNEPIVSEELEETKQEGKRDYVRHAREVPTASAYWLHFEAVRSANQNHLLMSVRVCLYVCCLLLLHLSAT